MTKSINLYMVKRGSKLEFRAHQKVLYDAFVEKLKEDDTIHIKMQKNQPRKTVPQLGYLFGVLYPFSVDALREAGHDSLFDISVGEFRVPVATTIETVDLLYKTLFREYKQFKNLPQKRKMSVDEMSEYLEFILKWLAENLGVYAPTPEDR